MGFEKWPAKHNHQFSLGEDFAARRAWRAATERALRAVEKVEVVIRADEAEASTWTLAATERAAETARQIRRLIEEDKTL